MASPRRNLCDDILRLIDETLADHERLMAVAVLGGRPLRTAPPAAAPRPGGLGSVS
jgi:hypothetical protein